MSISNNSSTFRTKVSLITGLFLCIFMVPVVALFAVCEFVTATLPFCTAERHPLLAVLAIAGLCMALVTITAKLVRVAPRGN